MTTYFPQRCAQDILCLSREMYQHARRGEWHRFSELETQRQKIINDLFAHPQINLELENLAATLRQVMEIDNKSLALGEKEKQQLAGKMTGFKQQRQAAKIYHLVSTNCSYSDSI